MSKPAHITESWQKYGNMLQSGEVLPVMEAFYTLQGEGAHTGKAAYFIRLGGCDVGCHWCDVKESWQIENHPLVPVKQIVAEAAAFTARTVVLTGGEPYMHNLSALSYALHSVGFQINIETSGAYPSSGEMEWICLSPKKFKPPLEEMYRKANELKVVIYNKSDFEWAEKHAEKVNSFCHLFLQPEWAKQDKMLPQIIDYIKLNPKWRMSLQTHKFMNIP